ncbi:MAG: zinc-binding alcohol dehydrogenase family protein [Salaquimonas sp.]|nr:zinc-binding alcohol dehydrogenase family protein [Salaquimonas sp.]
MDALVCSEPGRLELVRRPAPEITPDSALVRPRRVGICGTDYHIYEGKHPFLQYPRVMGHELAVEIVQAPEGSGFAPGEICVVNPYLSCGHCVACRAGKPNCCANISVLGVHQDGGMAGLLSVPPGNLIPAEGLSADQCAAVEFLAIGAHAVRRGGVAKRDRVLVVGIGPIGLGVSLFARLSGAKVAACDRDPERLAVAREIADIDTIVAGDDPLAEIDAHTNGEGFDVVFDATGNPQAMERGFDYVGHGGRYVLVSVVNEPLTFLDPDFHRKEMTLLGSRNATMEDFEHVMAAIRTGAVPVERLITHRTTLADAAADIPRWAADKTGLIKAMIEIGG